MIAPEQRFAQPIRGHAYRPLTRVLAVTIALATLAYGASVAGRGDGVAGALLFMVISAGLVMVFACWYIVMGRTTIDARGVHQDWIMAKSYGWGEIRSARILRLPLSTRLMLNTGRPPFKVIQSGTPEITAAFEEIVAFYTSKARS
ncbi:MAG: hypothetical protein K0B16_07000 [Burkholderiaceae bacterium]|nr:hypothetical protein [Burkholderiaceae bacterium]